MKKEISYVLLVSFSHIGDYNQAKEMERVLTEEHSILPKFIDIDLSNGGSSEEYEKIGEQIKENQSLIYHFIGEKGLLTLLNCSAIREMNTVQILQIHQYMEQLKELTNLSLLIIPEESSPLAQALSCQKLYLRSMIFEKISAEQLKHFYESSSISKNLSIEEPYIIVMLSGDAPDREGNMHYFTKQSANDLLSLIKKLKSQKQEKSLPTSLIIQNGPRTGKHDPHSGNVICSHSYNRESQTPEMAVDNISRYFISKLDQIEGLSYRFFNFAFEFDGQGNKKVISFYRPLLHLAKQEHNLFVFPLQSVSMCSELPYYIAPGQLIGYHTSSTNSDHLQYAMSHFERGLFNLCKEGPTVLTPSSKVSQPYDETKEVIEKILNMLH